MLFEGGMIGDEANAHDTRISVEICEDDDFETSLGKELVVSDDLGVSMEELAALVLWSMTWNAFANDEEELLPTLVLARDSIIYGGHVVKNIERRTRRAESIIRSLTASPTEPCFKRDDLQFLFTCETIDGDVFHSYAFDAKARMRYIADLVTEYPDSRNPIYYSKYRGLLIYVTTSVAHPIGMNEWSELLWLADRTFRQCPEVRCGAGIDDYLHEEIRVYFICYR